MKIFVFTVKVTLICTLLSFTLHKNSIFFCVLHSHTHRFV